ncbi:MAG: exopolyphosphatase / guanosine-5-triphosphate,3-diphosphate pyrophosphatase [Thermotogaceae bacterium]|jgi:exopolyphosphatase/guanosine-5'-triphosphate,3'-diphosphate pyrophosphatase|nr:exopolyphosphatase / guanosine-5-triphosphate,3-diphosphate pyrophosphatase [Thermotogaceae bacterium]MDN5338257.1 exopolyphosphatase / guanosine-5-triphosphate,3-diphosphate pyrophosphatase [Thermotogaceae bacterium]
MISKKTSAAIDLGSNSFILTIVDENGELVFEKLITVAIANESEPLQIRIERARNVLNYFVEKLEKMNTERAYIFGTQFFRKNPDVFNSVVENVKDSGSVKINIKILSEKEEALMSYFSVKLDPVMSEIVSPVVVDIGGGSVEIVFEGKSLNYKSLELGAWKLTNRFVEDFPIGFEIRKKMEDFVLQNLEIPDHIIGTLVGIGGTFVTLAAMFLKKDFDSFSKLNGTKVPRKWLVETVENLFKLDLEDIRKIKGLPAERAKIIPAGGLVVMILMEQFSKEDHFIVSSKGCRYSVARFGFDLESLLRRHR